jgi:TatD family-associated radical SAM protein
MSQCITYTIKNGLYVNMTNRCTCACDFCERERYRGVGDVESLWLEYEPSREEIWDDIAAKKLSDYEELVFCGYGEPTLRLDDLLWIAQRVKEEVPNLPIRINTNGHANMIAGRDVTPEFAGLIDALSISLNRSDASKYYLHMKPVFGEKTFDGLLEFAVQAQNFVPHVMLSVVDVLDEKELDLCKSLSSRLGVPLIIRAYH